MTIENQDLHQLLYVDGLPGAGQTRIDWIQDGEDLEGADSAITNEGALNRGAVKVQKNVATLNDNVTISKTILDKVVDVVNVHDAIINTTGDGTNIYDRVTAVEKTEGEIKVEMTEIKATQTATDASIAGIKSDIGIQSPTEPKTAVRQEIRNIKTMLGNYKGFDVNGNPDINAPGLGVKGQVERNWENITKHETRIAGLEKWWDGDTPDVLIRNTRDLRNELGPTTAATDKTVYDRLTATETHDAAGTAAITRVDIAINTAEFPMNYTTRTGEAISVANIWEYNRAVRGDVGANQTALFAAQTDISNLKTDIGTPSIDKQVAWTEIEFNRSKVTNLEGIVGLTPADGIRGALATQVAKQANDYDRHDGIIKSLSDTTNLDHTPKINDLTETIDTPKVGLKDSIRGTADDADTEYKKLGISETGRRMYENMYQPFIAGSGFILDPTAQNVDASYVRKFVASQWQWVDAFDNDIVVGTGKTIRTPQGLVMLSHLPRVGLDNQIIFGSTDKDVALRGNVIENINMVGSKILMGGQPALGVEASQLVLGNGTLVNIKTSDKDSLVVSYGGTSKEVIHTGNLEDFVQDIDPRLGFAMNRDTHVTAEYQSGQANVILHNFAADTMTLGDANVDLQIDGYVTKMSLAATGTIRGYTEGNILVDVVDVARKAGIDRVVLGDNKADVSIRAHGSDLRSVKISTDAVDYTVWHDGIDAPSDNAFYARRDGVWTAFNPSGGGGGIGDEAPDNGMQYTRVSTAGTGTWDLVGAKDIALANNVKLKGNTTNGVIDIISVGTDGVLRIGELSDRRTVIGGIVDSLRFNENSKVTARILNQDMTVISVSDQITIGDTKTQTVFANVPKVTVDTATHRVWHDGMDAPGDTFYYARQNHAWAKVFNGVDPDSDVSLNGKAYKSLGMVVGGATQLGSDIVVTLGDVAAYTKLNGKVMNFTLAQPSEGQSTDIRGMLDGVDVNVIAIADKIAGTNQVVVGDGSLELALQASRAMVNGDTIVTINAFDAPKDGKRYSRKDGQWVDSYYYGNFTTDKPDVPKEGDVFFEFVN